MPQEFVPMQEAPDVKAEPLDLKLCDVQFASQVHAQEGQHSWEETVRVKEEPSWESSAELCGVSAAAARAGLYAGHQVKGELVLGPECLQPRDAAYALRAASDGPLPEYGSDRPPGPARGRGSSQPPPRDCCVRLARLTVADLSTRARQTQQTSQLEQEMHGSQVATGKDTYECAICKKQFALKFHLVEHVAVHIHTRAGADSDSLSACGVQVALRECSVRLPRLTLSCGNRNTLPRLPLSCGNRNTLPRLPLSCGNRNTLPRLTLSCGNRNTLPRNTDLHRHIRLHWNNLQCSPKDTDTRPSYPCDTREQRVPTATDSRRRASTRRRIHSCGTCKKQFTKLGNLKKHESIHTGVKPHSCEICQKKFREKKHLTLHTRSHTGEKPYSCKICAKKFRQSSHLKTHIVIHSDEKPYACEICKKRFKRASEVKPHQRIHTGEKRFSCGICNKRFRYSHHVRIHNRVHTGVKLYSCEICKKEFADPRSLNNHDLIHAGEKLYSCKICKRKFLMLRYLNSHKRIHTNEKPYACKICKMKFRHSSSLRSHMRIHTGEKPFTCDICKKEFRESIYLKYHTRIHTGEKPFSCEICKKSFNHPSNFQKHVLTHGSRALLLLNM